MIRQHGVTEQVPTVGGRRLRRRDFLRFSALGSGGLVLAGVLAACGASATATPTRGATGAASSAPSSAPSTAPSSAPSTAPSIAPSIAPSSAPSSAAPAATASRTAGAATTVPAGTATRAAAPATTTAAATPGGTGGAATPTASGPVSFFVTGDAAEKVAYEQLVASFNQRQSQIKVAIEYVPNADDYTKRFTAELAAGVPSDIVLLNYRRYGAFAAKGAFEPVAPYLAKSTALKQTDLYPELIPAFSRGGQLYGIPQNASSLVIYCNKDLFQKAGLALPTGNWTWDEFLKAAQGLTKGTEQYGIGIAAQMIRVAPFIWQNGGDIVDNLQAPTKLTFDLPASVEAVQWFVDLQVKHKVAPDAVQLSAEDDEKRFLNGRSAMFFDSRRFTPTMREIKTFDWDVAPLPTGKSRVSILHSDAYFMTAASKNKPAAFAFMEYANGPDGQPVIARTGRTVPSIKSVAESPVFLDPSAKPANNRVFLEAIPVIRPTINIDTTEQIESIVNNELKRAFLGQAPVAEAIATMTSRTAELFKK